MQAEAVATGDNFQIINGCKSNNIQNTGIESAACFLQLIIALQAFVCFGWECYDRYLHAIPNRPVSKLR